MILIDTSVLINYFKGINNPQTKKFEEILETETPFGINNLIYQEVLQGASAEKEFNLLNGYLSSQKFYELRYGTKSYENAAKMYYLCRKKGITPRSTIDLLIAETAVENNLFLLHDDKDYSEIASVVEGLKEY